VHESNWQKIAHPLREFLGEITGTWGAMKAFWDTPSWKTFGDMTEDLAVVGEPPPAAELGDDAEALTAGHYPGLRLRSGRAAALDDGGPYLEMRVVRFMLTTPHGPWSWHSPHSSPSSTR
jgi:hypothetical protein